ncbi:hypothetical protein BDV23DRAFT_185656 [Aspergillus alliaceus]|uniref:beta-glucosidase n=1 Tax=Petromyces alliaceus TaxID=209559 RepID=A0A5N7C252_PETAA|nr:hypothetical protein BDV23DRAFT_185656 [Aspergillus alliaceus]
MSLIEKVNLTTGSVSPAELGIPSLCLQDSPLAIRFADYNSAFPTGVNVAATWDKTLAYLRSQAMGEMPGDATFDSGMSFWGANLTVGVLNGTTPQ